MPIDEKTVQATFERMKEKLAEFIPAAELKTKAEIVYEINRLKKERNAVILGHNYMSLLSFIPFRTMSATLSS
jgi:quinolinate synthase